jgi:uncharacterized repeat protein (TIGR01451 family)
MQRWSPVPTFRPGRHVLGLLLTLAAGAAFGQVTVNQILFPVNIGRTLDSAVTIDYIRTAATAATITTVIPAQLAVDPPAPPAGCSITTVGGSPAVACTVPAGLAGDTGSLGFTVRGATLGSFSLVATATGGSSASNTGTVRSSGDLTIGKTRSPAGNLLPGQSTTFTLQPQVAAGGDDLPAGASITVTDQLPGTVTDFNLTAIGAGIASCNSVASANSTRTVSCTIAGPRTVAEINAASITVTGAPGTTGNFTNVGSIATVLPGYFDRDANNNTANVNYSVDDGGDVQALGSFPSAAVVTGSAQTLTLRWRNNGPTALPAGGTVSTTIPAGFTVSSLPAGCSGPATGVVLAAPAALSCNAAAAAVGSTQDFVVPLLMPATAASGSFSVTVAPPAGYGDAVLANNTVTLPWQVVEPFADLRGSKSKSPASGPIAPGSTITTTLTVTNDAASTNAAVHSASGGGTDLRVVDYLKPAEIAGDALASVSAGWACSVSNNADPADATRSKRVECVRSAGGSLAPGASLSVSFTTTVAPVVGQVTLSDRVCAGETVLAQLGLTPAQGPQPPGSGQTGNDCAVAGSNLIATDVGGGGGAGSAAVTIVKESSNDGVNWSPPAAAPLVAAAAGTQFWRITITTPAAAPQAPIPTLNLSDPLPGILNVASPGAPAPAYVTPAIAPTVTGAPAGSCPALGAGSANLACSFSNVAPGSTIVVRYEVQRPFGAGTLTNTATLSSPDAILSGTLSASAALTVEPRIDVATTTKTVTPATPRIGQVIQFTVTAQNLGPNDVTAAGEFKLIDDLNTSTAGTAVAFGDITASGTDLACTVAGSALPDEAALAANHVRVRCTNTTPVARYSTRTMTITARVLKPAALPAAGTVYSGQSNTARVDIPDAQCEFKTETSSNASVSAACNDAASTSNNTRSVVFDVLVPQIDVQQRKTRVLPAGQTSFGVGQPLRYRFRLQNNGPSRAEGVVMTDRLSVPAGFTLASPQVRNVNGVPAEAGYVLDSGKNASVGCTQAAANADVVCVLAPTPAASFLDSGREVNFEIELAQTGNALTTVSFGNEALVCADESAGFETAGACNRTAANNNNVAAVNDVIFPRTDLALGKTTVTPSPVGINQPVEFRLEARNLGPSATQQIRIGDTLPPGFELITTGASAPALALGSFVTAAPSTATGASLSCTAAPAAIAVAGQQQTVSCVIDATPGPLGAGAFPGSSDAGNAITLRLFARPKEGLYAGPYLGNLTNSASVGPGLDGAGNPLTIDTTPGNNSASSVVQVARSSLAGRVFLDRDGNGVQNGTDPAQDEGIGNVTITLSGADAWGHAVTRTLTTVNAVGATRGDFLFDHLPPGSYTVTETQPTGYENSAGTPAAASAGGGYLAAASVATSRWSAVTLPLNTAATGYLFPESLPASGISGRVFSDRNDNGALDAADAGLAGVTLGLYPAGTACPAAGALPAGALQTVTTDANGAYRFTAVTAGTSYEVCQQQPAGHADRTPLPGASASTPRANQISIVNLPAAGSSGNDFPELLGRIAGLVFMDYSAATPVGNDNGAPDGGEPGIGSATPGAGVPVTLTGTPSAGPGAGVPIAPRTTTTAADGSWRFDDLLPGSYSVTQGAIPLALGTYRDGTNTAGPVLGGGSAGTAGAVGDNAIRGIVLGAAGAGSSDNRFAELPRTTISGVVFVDANADNQFTAADTLRLAGVTVELRQGGTSCANASLLGSTRTAGDGSWVFPGGSVVAAQVQPGQTYRVCELQPDGFANGPTLPGGSAASPRPDEIVVTNLPVTGSGQNHFGERSVPAGGTPGPTISGTVFIDRNRDGQLGLIDTGRIGGVAVRLVDGASCSGAEVDRAVTNDGGRYVFPASAGAQLVAGRTYSVCELQPEAWADGATRPGPGNGSPAANHIVIAALPGGGSGDNDFGEWGGRIDGQVFLDRDRNGARDGSDVGIPGVTVTLTREGSTETRSTTTGPDGRFAFDDLPAGRWTLTEQAEQPRVVIDGASVATLDGRTTPGAGGGTATPVDTRPSAIAGITLPAGGQALDNLFAEVPGAGAGAAAPDLVVGKAAREARFLVGRTGHYVIAVRNAGGAPTSAAYTVSDRLPDGLTLAGVPAGSGWTCSGAAGAGSFSCSSAQVLAAGASAAPIELAVQVAAAAAGASPVSNAVLVEGGGESADRAPGADERDRFANRPDALPLCTQPATHNACRSVTEVQLPAALSGTVWLELGPEARVLDGGDRRLPGWIVELVDPDTGRVIATTTTGADGRYRFADLEPGRPYGVRFRDPASGVVYVNPVNGEAGSPAAACSTSAVPSSCTGDRGSPQLRVVLAPGQELTQQSLPVDPSGVVYDSGSREPVAGAVVTLGPVGSCPAFDPAQHVAAATLGGYVVAGDRIGMTTGDNGFYQFVLLPSAPARCLFGLTVAPPPAWRFPSDVITPQAQPLVPVGAPGSVVRVQPQPLPPTTAPGPGTTYHLELEVGSATPDVVHNHIPVDPSAPTGLLLRKTGDRAVAELGDTVRYSITVRVTAGALPRQVTVDDRLPAGFTYVSGTAFVDGRRIADPAGAPGPRLAFQLGAMPAGGSVTLQYRVRVGVGAQQGDGVNVAVAWACNQAGSCLQAGFEPVPAARASNDGRHRVRVAGGVFALEACVLGKVFVDCNGNHVQDREELGIPGVRLVLQDGTFLTSDSEGKYSACGLPPKSHVLRIDESTLPRGARLTTSSNRNLGDAGSLWLDLKHGELQRADFIEGSCSNPVLDQVKARRAQGEVGVPQVEKAGRPALRFDSKAHGRDALTTPTQGTDSANQPVPKMRPPDASDAKATTGQEARHGTR